MCRGFLAVLCFLLFAPILCFAQHDVSGSSITCFFNSPSGMQGNLLLKLPDGPRALRKWNELPPDFFVQLIPEFRMPEQPQRPPTGEFGAATKDHCLPAASAENQEGNEPDSEKDAPSLIPKWRIYPFYMNPPAEVPRRGECDVYLLLHEYSVWRCPEPLPFIRRT
jgi:hypothetical protein